MMKNIVVAVGFLFASAIASTAAAQPSCGTQSTRNNLRAAGPNATVELLVQTARDNTLCLNEVQAEGWVNGAGGAQTDRGPLLAEVHMFVPTGVNGVYHSTGKHWLIANFTAFIYLGTSFGGPAAATGGACVPPTPDWQCADGGGRVADNGCGCVYDTPIIADVAGDGYRLTSADSGVFFDIDADGQAEQIAWTRPDSDDAFLALDRNNNGTIDNGSELFGNFTPAYNDQVEPPAVHGFMALKFAEGPSYGPSVADEVIDSHDSVFSRLLLWQDANHNGVSEPGELTSASALGLTAISTKYRESRRKDRHGNVFALKSKSWWTTPAGLVERPVFDVHLTR